LYRLIGRCAALSTSRRLRQFQKNLPRSRRIQDEILLQVLRANRQSRFGHRHSFARIRSYRDYSHSLPLCQYDYFAPYIDCCRKGDTNALFGPSQKLLMFALTSGTTAPAKYIPVTSRVATAYHHGWNIWGIKALSDHPDCFYRKILQVTSPAQEFFTESGLPCGAISGMLARRQKFIVRRFYAVPYCLSEIPEPQDRYYSLMRFALAEDVALFSTANPSTALTLARTAEKHAEKLIRDIRDGSLDQSVFLTPSLSRRLTSRLRPQPTRARQLEQLLQKHGRLLPQHYWNLSFLAHWTGGTLGLYIPQLREYYGQIPIRDIGLLASEGRMSIPLEDNTPAGVLDIQSNFYEFIPEQEIENLDLPPDAEILPDHLTVLRAEDLEKGACYYILLTNFAGLYRYHIGDLVRVTDFIGSTPVIEFLSKGAHFSSLTGEKLTEHQVVAVVNKILNEMSLDLDTYLLAPVWSDPPGYCLYVQVRSSLLPEKLNLLAEQVDRQLFDQNIEYSSKRKSTRLAPLRAQQVPDDALTSRDHRLLNDNHGRAEQFKHRFLLNQPLKLDKIIL